ncbi:MAG: hypothetical protein KJ630_01295 [Proteobacteria bacterium]|nr:hypothetical protein [Pseudomonadota bacterium]
MNGTCQTCGTIAPIEWFLSETEHRLICGILPLLPKDVEKMVFHYLSLFRPVTGRAIQAKRATRLLCEIKDLVTTGYIQIDKKVTRPCPPRIWAQAMEQMVERRDRLTIPMPNHNYLKTIAYDLADQADGQAERTRNTRPITRTGQARLVVVHTGNPLDQYIQGLRDDKPTDEEMAEWKHNRLK